MLRSTCFILFCWTNECIPAQYLIRFLLSDFVVLSAILLSTPFKMASTAQEIFVLVELNYMKSF